MALRRKNIRLPKDALPHDTIIEWWYFNGNLADSGGKRYAFMDCLFRADVKRVNIPFLKQPFKNFTRIPYAYFAHSVVSDIGARKSWKDVQTASLVSRDSFSRPLLYANYLNPLQLNGFSTSEIAEERPGVFRLKTEKLDLRLDSRGKAPVLHGDRGIISVSDRKSWYYSLVGLRAEGLIEIGGEWIQVSGGAWMDHQWADEAYRNDAWTWFSIQLDDGTTAMCVEYDDHKTKDYEMTVTDRSGQSQRYKNFSLAPGKESWTSRETKAEYPLAWTIKTPGGEAAFKVRALLPDQEMIFGGINYWEGPAAVEASINGKNLKGAGFMELVGCPSDYSALALAGKKIGQEIRNEASSLFKKIF